MFSGTFGSQSAHPVKKHGPACVPLHTHALPAPAWPCSHASSPGPCLCHAPACAPRPSSCRRPCGVCLPPACAHPPTSSLPEGVPPRWRCPVGTKLPPSRLCQCPSLCPTSPPCLAVPCRPPCRGLRPHHPPQPSSQLGKGSHGATEMVLGSSRGFCRDGHDECVFDLVCVCVCGGGGGGARPERGGEWATETIKRPAQPPVRQLLGPADAGTTPQGTLGCGRQNAVTRRSTRREEGVTVQGPVQKLQRDGTSHRGSLEGRMYDL